jgi:hypothetical protein
MAGDVTRWRRYGKDRLYVTGADGTKLGYRDLVTGENHLTDPTHAAEFAALVSAWVVDGAASPPQPVPDATPPPEPDPEPEREPEWEDLAQRSAGAMARQQAIALKDAAPVRTLVARLLGVRTDERAWRIGADGEEMVAAQLAKLARKDPRWQFLHAIPVGKRGSDIDHLVIGPGGVFTLNAKHHPRSNVWVGGDTCLVNGQRQPYIRNSRHEARRAGHLLTRGCGFPVAVTGVVVPVGASNVTIRTAPADVYVVNRMRLARWLADRRPVLPDDAIAAIFTAARRSTTWSPTT